MDSSGPFFDIILNDKDNFGVAEFKGQSNVITTNVPNDITQATLDQDLFKPSEKTTYEITFTPYNPIPKDGAIEITWPDQITVPEG